MFVLLIRSAAITLCSLVFGLLIPVSNVDAQTGKDCFNAIPICDTTFAQTAPAPGDGVNALEIDPAVNCLLNGEENGYWYRIRPQSAGNLSFEIVPDVVTDNFDFLVLEQNDQSCEAITGNLAAQVSCNYSTTTGITGANGGSFQTVGGPLDAPENNVIAVAAGETYLIYVGNPDTSANGYTINLSPTLGYDDTIAPAFSAFETQPLCGDQSITVQFESNVLCSSLDITDFRLETSEGLFLPSSVTSSACQQAPTNGHSPVVTLTFPNGIQGTGDGELFLVDAVEAPCGATSSSDSITFSFNTPPPLTVDEILPVTCGDNVIQMVMSDPVDCASLDTAAISITDTSGAALPLVDVQSGPCNAGESGGDTILLVLSQGITAIGVDYTVDYDGTFNNICGEPDSASAANLTFQIVDTLALDLGPDTSICETEPEVQLNADITGGPNAKIFWLPNSGLDNATLPNPTATVNTPTTYVARVYNNNCLSNWDTLDIAVVPVPNFTATGDFNICQDTVGTIFLSGAQSFEWLNDGVFASQRQLGPATTTTYDIVPFNGQCAQDTFQVTVNVTETPDGFVDAPDTVCTSEANQFGFNGTFQATDNFSWDWDGGTAVSGSNFGPYDVIFPTPGFRRVVLETNTYGCIDTFRKDLQVVQRPVVNAGNDIDLCGQQAVQLEAQVIASTSCTFEWLSPGGLPNVANPVVSPASSTDYIVRTTCGGCVSEPDTVRVNVLPRPTATAPQNVIEGCEGVPETIAANANGGVGALSYEWLPSTGLSDNTDLNPIANPTSSTLYTLTVTDDNGCTSDPLEVDYIVNTRPIADAGPDQVFCEGSPGVQLEGAVANPGFGTYAFQWIPEAGLTDATDPETYALPGVTTDYELVVTNLNNGCTSAGAALNPDAVTTVFVEQRPIADAGPDRTICLGDTFVAGIQQTGLGGPDWDFAWTPFNGVSDPGDNRPTLSPDFTTQYYFTVISENGCESLPDTLDVTVLPRPNVVITTPDTGVCPYDSIVLNVDVAGATPDIEGYQWTPSALVSNDTLATTFGFPDAPQSTFKVGVETASCLQPTFDSITVAVRELPIVDVIPGAEDDVTICPGEAFTVPAQITAPGPLTFEWTPDDGFISDVSALNPVVSPPTTENYILQAVYNGCTARDTLQVFVVDSVVAEASVDTNRVCEGESVTLTALTEEPVAYQWLPEGGILNPSERVTQAYPEQSLVYQLVVERDGCTDTAAIPVTVLTQPTADFNYNVTRNCTGGEVQFMSTSSDANGYFWDFGDGNVSNAENPVHRFPSAGDYNVSLRVVAVGTCDDEVSSDQTIRIQPRANADFEALPVAPDTLKMPNADLSLRGLSEHVANWFWQLGDGRTGSDSTVTHTYERPGEYTVRLSVIDSAGCTDDTLVGKYVVLEPRLPVPNVFTPNGDGINDEWSPGYTGNAEYELYITGRTGRVWFSSTQPSQSWRPLEEAPEGVYFYRLKIGDNIYKGSFTLLR